MPTLISTKQFLSVLFISFLCNSLFLTSTFAQNEIANADMGFVVEICKENIILSINDNISKLNQSCFEEIVLDSLNKKEYKDRIWLKITITDTKKEFLDFNQNIDSIKVYHNQKVFLTGSLVAQSKKQLPLSIAISAITIPVYNQPFYVEIISSQKYPISTSLEVLTDAKFTQTHIKKRQDMVQFQIFFQGMMWIILLYNLFLFLSSKEKVYLAYTIYIFGFSIFSLQNSGLLIDYFASETPYFSLLFRMFALATIAVGFSYFILTFLPSHTINKFWKRGFYILGA